MSISDTRRILDLEAAVAALLARVAVLEGARCVSPTQRPSSAPADGAELAEVIGALRTGQSIRRAAEALGLDRNKVARLRQRAIAEGWLAVSQTETMRQRREA